jgi:hypothetical protein
MEQSMSETAKTSPEPKTEIVKDELGRDLALRAPNFMQKARITRLCGDDSTNLGYMYGFVWPTCWVVAIDGIDVPFPNTEKELLGLMTRLGEEGVAAVLKNRKEVAEAKGEMTVEAGAKN